jgi:hypothetical protein
LRERFGSPVDAARCRQITGDRDAIVCIGSGHIRYCDFLPSRPAGSMFSQAPSDGGQAAGMEDAWAVPFKRNHRSGTEAANRTLTFTTEIGTVPESAIWPVRVARGMLRKYQFDSRFSDIMILK